jgi:hypothetical protein
MSWLFLPTPPKQLNWVSVGISVQKLVASAQFSHFDSRKRLLHCLQTVPLSIGTDASGVQEVDFLHSPALKTSIRPFRGDGH